MPFACHHARLNFGLVNHVARRMAYNGHAMCSTYVQGLAQGQPAPPAQPQKKKKEVKESPVPEVRYVPGYTREYLPLFKIPETYIKGKGGGLLTTLPLGCTGGFACRMQALGFHARMREWHPSSCMRNCACMHACMRGTLAAWARIAADQRSRSVWNHTAHPNPKAQNLRTACTWLRGDSYSCNGNGSSWSGRLQHGGAGTQDCCLLRLRCSHHARVCPLARIPCSSCHAHGRHAALDRRPCLASRHCLKPTHAVPCCTHQAASVGPRRTM